MKTERGFCVNFMDESLSIRCPWYPKKIPIKGKDIADCYINVTKNLKRARDEPIFLQALLNNKDLVYQ